jgi:hypothetical protein
VRAVPALKKEAVVLRVPRHFGPQHNTRARAVLRGKAL